MLRRFLIILTAAGALSGGMAPSAGATTGLPAGFETSLELSGLTRPTRIAWAPDGRRFVTEKDGVLKVAAPGSDTLQTVLDIRSEVNSFLDRGMLGLAVDSSFATNGYVYVLYSYDLNRSTSNPGPDAEAPAVSQLRRLKLGTSNQILDSDVILGTRTSGICPAPDNDVDCIPSDGTSHSIGTVLSAPDGSLFVSSGDAADFATVDPLALRSYDEGSLAGKILRIDRDGRGLPGHPFCPSEADLTRVCTKLYAKGFRNPYRFQRLANGDLIVGDVGWETYEEIDLVRAGGKSFGWPCYEGPVRTPAYRDWNECRAQYAMEGTASAHVGPIHSYRHDYTLRPSWAVVVGPEYTGDSYPAGYRGTIFWGDYGGGFLKRLQLGSNGQVSSISDVGTGWDSSVDIVTAPNGDIAWVDLGNFDDNAGFVDRLEYTPGNAGPNAVVSASPTSGPLPLTVSFDATGSSDPDGDSLSYDWNFGDGSPRASSAKPSHAYTAAGTYTVTLTVSDGRGRSDTDTLLVNAANSPPVPSIGAPAAGSRYRPGTAVTVAGGATDAQDGSPPASAFSWSVVVVHKDHEHLLANPRGVKTFAFTPVRDHGADSHYLIKLTVTDAGGASAATEREIHPETVGLHLRSSPEGAPLSFAGTGATAPWDTDAAVGFVGTLSAPSTFTSGGVQRDFVRWSSGAARVHDLTVPDGETTLTALYNAGPAAVANVSSPTALVAEQLQFGSSGSGDPDGEPLAYEWSFGDGATATGATASHAFTAPGEYEVVLTVRDGAGAVSTATTHVSVKAAGGAVPPPKASDSAAPLLRPWRPARRPTKLAGIARDPSGVDSVELAVARLAGAGRCRWLKSSGALGPLEPCSPRQWVRARLGKARWELALPRGLPPGPYRMWMLARDRQGNVGRHTSNGLGSIRFRVPRPKSTAACEAALLRTPLRCSSLRG